ncbi:MAG TPA: hypothetical protein VFW19_10450 [Allosphingosinicella sp.]|nr:hypothetical protein [Allosphingosinicella sp.]
MIWECSHRYDPRAVRLADRHYSRQKPGTPQFMKAGSCAVFYAEAGTGKAVWGTSWQRSEWVKHAWPGAWECAIFRNEGVGKASTLIRQAVAATRAHYGAPPTPGMITFVDPSKVREKANPGHCFIIAGFRPAGHTAGGLLALRLAPEDMPNAEPARWSQWSLFGEAA